MPRYAAMDPSGISRGAQLVNDALRVPAIVPQVSVNDGIQLALIRDLRSISGEE